MNLILNPLWLVILPLGMAPVVYVVRRRGGLAGLLAGMTTLVTARLCLSMPFDWSLQVLGRNMLLRPADRMFLAFAFFLVTLYFIYAWSLSQGWSFSPFVLIIMGLFSASTMVDNTIIAVLLLEAAAALTVLVIQAGRHSSIKAGLHYLVTVTLAIPPLLIAAHLSEMRILNPADTTLPRLTGLLLIFGFGLFLGVVPFQSWLSMVSTEAPPMVSAFLFSVGSSVVIFKMFGAFHKFPWLVTDGDVLHLALLAGVASVILGGVLAAFQRDFGRLLGWAGLADMGFLLVSLSPGSSEALAVSALLLLNRWVAISLICMGMGVLRRERQVDSFEAMAGVIWHKPFSVFGLAVGGLSLAGFPLTGGFTAHWLALQVLTGEARKWIVVLILASITISIGYLRGVAQTAGEPTVEPNEAEPFPVRLLILGLVAVSMFLALYPQIALQPITQVMTTLLVPK